MSFHIDILPIRNTTPRPELWGSCPPPEPGELSSVEIGYTIQDCVDKGWLVDRGDEG
mgnify:CR=1 FL=1